MSYLDKIGLARVWDGIKSTFVSKDSIDNAGITNRTYSTKFGGEFTVTTVASNDYVSPYARASVTGRINKENLHRVTFNGTEYILQTRLWYGSDSAYNIKVYEYLGNLNLYISDLGSSVPDGTDNVPFIIISDLNNSGSIDVLTQTAGTYTILVEQINNTQKRLPTSLIYGDSYAPILKNNNGGTYNGFSIGVNKLSNKRGTFAFGYGNDISNEFNYAFGVKNTISGSNSLAFGVKNTISGSGSLAFGRMNNITGAECFTFGYELTANAENMVAMGRDNVSAKTDFPEFKANTFYKKGDIAKGKWVPQATFDFVMICIEDHVSGNVTTFSKDKNGSSSYWSMMPSSGDTILALGNGTNTRKSNAMKVDWIGNQYLGGEVYVNCNADSTGGSKLATEQYVDGKSVDVQINGTSIVSSGIANIPIAGNGIFGVFKPGNGVYVGQSSGSLYIDAATSANIKAGTEQYKPIVSIRQHESAFYGLAKAAGDSTQSASSNAVGIYTDEAKGAIQHMLGTDNLAPYESDITADQSYSIGELFMLHGKLHRATAAINELDVFTVGTNCEIVNASDVFARDVRVNGTSVVSDGIAEIPKAIDNSSSFGVVGTEISFGIRVNSSGKLYTYTAGPAELKQGSQAYKPIVPANQHSATFYGLAKAAGDTTQSASSNAVGTYTDEAKAAIKSMLGIEDVGSCVQNITGTSVTITGQPNTRYVCGEVLSISITPPSVGTIDVMFTSGSTVAVLTLPNTVKMPEWWEGVEANYTYELVITDGVYAGVMAWPI